MSYLFSNPPPATGYIHYYDPALVVTGDCAWGAWLNAASVRDGDCIFQLCHAFGGDNTFSPVQIFFISDSGSGQGNGILMVDGAGGAFNFRPGAIAPAQKWNANQWLYLGFSRAAGSKTVFSYAATHNGILDGPVFTYAGTPISFGSFIFASIGGSNSGTDNPLAMKIGPWSYWNITLSKNGHLAMAKCSPLSTTGMLLWIKMFAGATDSGPLLLPPTFVPPLPAYVPDDGCTSFASGQDYNLTSR